MPTANPPALIGVRYGRKAGLEMLTKIPLGELMRAAYQARKERMPENLVTFVYDTNPNYTNVCVTGCSFCAFSKRPGDREAYTLKPDELALKVKKAYDMGATTVLLQGGNNPDIKLKDWLAYIRSIREVCPDIHIHPFSPAEYQFMARVENVPVNEILETIYAEEIDTIPGGGAEILCDAVREKVAKNKASAGEWLDVCETAHHIGFRTTATMMYGHIETNKDIIEHLLKLRDLQDRTGGFTSFIPWSFKPGNSPLGKELRRSAHPAQYVRIIAVARLLLDNFQHIQSSWFSESIPAGQLGLLAGADDFGGVLVEENVLQQAGHDRAATIDDVLIIIRRAGFTPARRDSRYTVLEAYSGPDKIGVNAEPVSYPQ